MSGLELDFGRPMKLKRKKCKRNVIISTASLKFPFLLAINSSSIQCRARLSSPVEKNAPLRPNHCIQVCSWNFSNLSVFSLYQWCIFGSQNYSLFKIQNFLLRIYQSISTFPLKIGRLFLFYMQCSNIKYSLQNKHRLSTISA